jgi:hypothetical protein
VTNLVEEKAAVVQEQLTRRGSDHPHSFKPTAGFRTCRICGLARSHKVHDAGKKGTVRGRTKDECWRNYIHNKSTSGGVLVDFVPNNKQEAYEAMKRDSQTGIWTLEFVFTNLDQLIA